MLYRCLVLSAAWVGSPLWGFPNVCDVVNAPQFESEFALTVTYAMCPSPPPLPPWPCAHVNYNLPKYFIEVVNQPKQSLFSALPGVATQMAAVTDILPFAAEDDSGAYSYHAHALHVPFTQWAFSGMPCGGGLPDLFCFSAASEHLGSNWRTGAADLKQPQVLAWALSPKACMLKGAAVSTTGDWGVTGGGLSAMCSSSLAAALPFYPPTDAPVCTGWGQHLPRSGTVTSSDQTTASLVIASRIKSIGSDVFHSIASNHSDKWQMIYPQTSSSFKEGQNIALLRLKQVNEIGRLRGRLNKYLYAIWQQSSCTVEAPRGAMAHAWLAGVKAACGGMP